jgi:hypothetical protein
MNPIIAIPTKTLTRLKTKLQPINPYGTRPHFVSTPSQAAVISAGITQ